MSVVFAALLFTSHGVEPQAANGGWFIPPVVMIIVPMVLAPLAPRVAAADLGLLLVAGYASWGMGLLLFVLVASLLYDRLVFHPLPAAPLAPSLWIGLGPIGVGGLALLRLAQVGAPAVGRRRARRPGGLPDRGVRALGVRRSGGSPPPPSCSAPTCGAAASRTGSAGGPSRSRSGAYTASTLALARAWHAGAARGARGDPVRRSRRVLGGRRRRHPAGGPLRRRLAPLSIASGSATAAVARGRHRRRDRRCCSDQHRGHAAFGGS